MKFNNYNLEDLIICYDSKRKPLSAMQRQNRKGEYPYYGAQEIIDKIDDYIFDGNYILLAEDGENLRSNVKPIANLVKGRFWLNNHAHIFQTNDKCILEYLYYALLNTDVKPYVTGTTQPKLNQANMLKININIPELDKQKAIVKILKNIDNKINNNMHTNNNLYEIGKALYQEYFENDKYTNNYEIKQLSEVTTNNRKKIDQSRGYKVLSAVNTGNLVLSDDYFDKQVYSKDIGKYLNVNKNDFAYNPARINIGSIGLNTFDFNCCVSPVYVTFSVDKDYEYCIINCTLVT